MLKTVQLISSHPKKILHEFHCKPHWLEYKLNQPLFFSKKKDLFYLRLTDRDQIGVILDVS